MSSIALYIDIARNMLVSGPGNPSAGQLPALTQGDELNLQIYLLNPTGQLIPPYTQLSIAGLSMQMAIGDKKGSGSNYYASQFAWTNDPTNSYFYAAFSLNTAEITTLLGANPTATSTLEVKVIDANGNVDTVLSMPVTINASVIKDGGTAPQQGLTPISMEYVNANFLPRKVQGAIELVSPDGTKKVAVYVDNDGAFHTDPIP